MMRGHHFRRRRGSFFGLSQSLILAFELTQRGRVGFLDYGHLPIDRGDAMMRLFQIFLL
jgi:hypothetical protein